MPTPLSCSLVTPGKLHPPHMSGEVHLSATGEHWTPVPQHSQAVAGSSMLARYRTRVHRECLISNACETPNFHRCTS
ncbi:hypothetical protein BAUCODRAFT_255248 [Baudoinia panamericana UAMH 10762]|uniref:Uncharacterized protein n=1 Tax=Baudoinia panamericana (strain UAMH 10762) TaxID=717646 RepID=M2M8B0_BAUPA|nr:uncharacterized protein BAUCODRAFT_255248 [Baudoinia panamericana UAMH 10762]EMC92601.1 hypothetical protein BAUCODRAFT_255248 [Baudoinia panamericana UAMH 10762]